MSMSNIGGALQKIARGAGLVFAGTVISTLLGFATRAIIARILDKSQYGVFSLALTILNLSLVIILLGFSDGLPREVARYLKEYPEKLSELLSTSILIVLFTSLLITGLVETRVQDIAKIFDDMMLVQVLRVGALALSPLAVSGIVIAVSRGLGRVREKIYYQNILVPSLFLVFTIVALKLNTNVVAVFVAYFLAQTAGFVILLADSLRLKIVPKKMTFNIQLAKELVVFSFPLMFTGILGYIMSWTDTLMLGYYYPSDVVGLYNAAAPIARWIPVFLNAMGFLYTLIATALFVQGNVGGVKKLYQITTRWIFLLTFPIFVLIFAFPVLTIEILFESKYVGSSTALQLLAWGFMFHVTATAVSYIIVNLFRYWWLYRDTGIRPFNWSYLKQLGAGLLMLGVLYTLNIYPTNI